MGLDELLSAIGNTKRIQDHPDWEQFKTRKIPQFVSFYYTNQNGQEAYWDHARIIKLDLKKMLLIVEGAHGDPLKFDMFKIMHCKDAKTGEKAQDLFFELIHMWNDIHPPSE
jgi:hypothetical protein